jgi:hypothetical protein
VSKLHLQVDNAEATEYCFRCPGCGDVHSVRTAIPPLRPGVGGVWQWNGSIDKPTFSPSLLVTSGHYCAGHQGDNCWCSYNREHPDNPAPFACYRCHSYVKDGAIEFLGDCSHTLAGQTVEIPEWKE